MSMCGQAATPGCKDLASASTGQHIYSTPDGERSSGAQASRKADVASLSVDARTVAVQLALEVLEDVVGAWW